MSKLSVLVATIALAGSVQARAQSPGSEAGLAELVTACNVMASSPKPARRSIRACETLAMNGQLALVDQAAVIAYQRYSEERRLACERRQASPRGAAREQPCG
jgi:hypothetical protein